MQLGEIQKMQQSNASNFNINNVGGTAELQVMMRSMIGRINTGELVEVVDVVDVGVSPVGFVSVVPLVFKVDGDNNNVSRGVIHNVPYFRLQGGNNAIVIDPKVGDIGFCGFCSRDITMVKRNRKAAAPNTRRHYNISDAVYMGGMLNGTPSQYIQFLDNGINVKSTGDVNINGLVIKPDGTLVLKNGVIVDTHVHTQGNDSAGNTQQPTNGPQNA